MSTIEKRSQQLKWEQILDIANILKFDEDECLILWLADSYAPYPNYRQASGEEINEVLAKTDALPWLKQNMEDKIKSFAITTIAKDHLERVKENRRYLVEKTRMAVQERLTNEIRYWDHRARDLRMQEESGRPNAKLNSNEARKRTDDYKSVCKSVCRSWTKKVKFLPNHPW